MKRKLKRIHRSVAAAQLHYELYFDFLILVACMKAGLPTHKPYINSQLSKLMMGYVDSTEKQMWNNTIKAAQKLRKQYVKEIETLMESTRAK